MLTVFSSIQLIIINIAQSTTVALNNENHTNLTEVSSIPSAQVFIPKDTIFRLKKHEYPRLKDILSTIHIEKNKVEGFTLTDIKVNLKVAETDLLLDLVAEDKKILVTLKDVSLIGSGSANYTDEKVLEDWLALSFTFNATAIDLTIEVTLDQQLKQNAMIPALKFQNAKGKITDINYIALGDNDWAKILNGIQDTFGRSLKDAVKPELEKLLGSHGLADELAKRVNNDILQKAWPVETYLQQFDAEMRLNQIGLIKIVDDGLILRQNLRFHPNKTYKEYEVCQDPAELYKSNEHFYDASFVLGECFVNSLIKTLVDNQHGILVPIDIKKFGKQNLTITLKKADNSYVTFIQGKIKAKIRASVYVDYKDLPFTITGDANVSGSIVKQKDDGHTQNGIVDMGKFSIIPKIENVYNIDTSKSSYIPSALVDAIIAAFEDNLSDQLTPIEFPMPGICVNRGDTTFNDEFCVTNPQINVFREYMMGVLDLSF